jgi:hypothetical protein
MVPKYYVCSQPTHILPLAFFSHGNFRQRRLNLFVQERERLPHLSNPRLLLFPIYYYL